ncbi:MAG: hypothetical protein A3E85_03560 [Gammaproteobacteria bacterium RIFCSPHIGHO2_12_FULL_45_12]|nr:MAG: hypothetical protein A3E85_03560 [Gammaproteobacteria bacterium RIFCSPHIGHO2_12_FULL_45_12]
MKANEFITKLRSQGRYSFSIQEINGALGLNMAATLNALRRLKMHKLVVSPAKGFYLILPPEYQAYGCLPADMFIPDLMKHLELPYYVGFLSAAQFYGAAHQKPQRFQVVTLKNKMPIHCGRIYVEFIANKKVATMPITKFNTFAGSIAVAAPEVLAADLVTSPRHAAGINNVATILTELIESIDAKKLIELMKLNPELFWAQRIGYLLESLGFDELASGLAKALSDKQLHWARLVSHAPYNSLKRNNKWKIIVNTKVEADE